jgi:hypothetical protein
MARKINDIESIDREITRLRLRAKDLETKMDINFSYLQEHSSSLMVNSLLSGFINKESLLGSIINLGVQNERLRKTLGNLAEIIIDKLANAIDFLVGKMSAKKD